MATRSPRSPHSVPTFAELVGDEAEFFAHYFNREPLLRRGAIVGDPRDILSIADLDELLHLEAIRPPHIGVTSAGRAVPVEAYTTATRVQGALVADTVVPERVYELFRTGATLTWSSSNHHIPSLRALTRMLATRFAVTSGATVFLTPAGRQGFSPHHDPVDLFVIQLAGSKDWKLWKSQAGRRESIGHYKLEDLGEPAIQTTLRAGDVLYMPYNTPHVAAAVDEVSLHLSVMVQPRSWRELLAATVRRLLDDEEFQERPHLAENSVRAQADVLTARAALLADRLSAVDSTAELHRLMLQGRRSEGTSLGTAFQDHVHALAQGASCAG